MARFVLSAFADEAGSTLAEQIDALLENGISYIEPRFVDGRGILELSDEELREMRSALDEAGITVGSLGSPIGKYPIDAPFDEHRTAVHRALHAAQLLGTSRIRMFSFFVEPEAYTSAREEVLRRLRTMVADAEAFGIHMCHENESGIYGCHPAQVEDILCEVPALGGILDPANYIVNGADVKEGLRVTLPRLSYLHIKDAVYNDEGKHIIVPAGEGDGDQLIHGKIPVIPSGAIKTVLPDISSYSIRQERISAAEHDQSPQIRRRNGQHRIIHQFHRCALLFQILLLSGNGFLFTFFTPAKYRQCRIVPDSFRVSPLMEGSEHIRSH